jgi:SAM-dependent methyltransferase
MFTYLKHHNIITDNINIIHKGTRDDSSINVMQCTKTKLIFLDKIIKTDYKNIGLDYWNSNNILEARLKTYEDDERRITLFKKYTKSNYKHILDFGCGNGGFLKLLDESFIKYGIDMNNEMNNILEKEGMIMNNSLDKILHPIDCITMFHVLEHIQNPIELLTTIKNKLQKGSMLIIEVPSAHDILFNKYNSESFKNSTFWSQHLILYTKDTLYKLLTISGFTNINIFHYQRYNIFNHLHWLSHNKPGGHKLHNYKNCEKLIEEYNNLLIDNEETDTLIAICEI